MSVMHQTNAVAGSFLSQVFTPTFRVAVSTAKEGLFRGLSTVIALQSPEEVIVLAKIAYFSVPRVQW